MAPTTRSRVPTISIAVNGVILLGLSFVPGTPLESDAANTIQEFPQKWQEFVKYAAKARNLDIRSVTHIT